MDRWDDLLLKARVEMTGHQMRKEVTPEQAFDAAWDLLKINMYEEMANRDAKRAQKKENRAADRAAMGRAARNAYNAADRGLTAIGEAGVGAAARAIPGLARGAGRFAGEMGNMGRAFKQGWQEMQQQRQARRAQGAPPTLQENAAAAPAAEEPAPAAAEPETSRVRGEPPTMASARQARMDAQRGARGTNDLLPNRDGRRGTNYLLPQKGNKRNGEREPRQAAEPEPEQRQRALPEGRNQRLLGPPGQSLEPSQVPMRDPRALPPGQGPRGLLPAPGETSAAPRPLEPSQVPKRQRKPRKKQPQPPTPAPQEQQQPQQPDATVEAAQQRQAARANRRDADKQGGGPMFSPSSPASPSDDDQGVAVFGESLPPSLRGGGKPKPSSMADTPNRSEGPQMPATKEPFNTDSLIPHMKPTGDGRNNTRIPFRSEGLNGATELLHWMNPNTNAIEERGMVSPDELNTLREQGAISEQQSTRDPERTYTMVDPNYGLKPGAERPVFNAQGKRVKDPSEKTKSDDDFSLLPAALRARLLKEQQPDTSTDYSLLPNGWSQGDLQ